MLSDGDLAQQNLMALGLALLKPCWRYFAKLRRRVAHIDPLATNVRKQGQQSVNALKRSIARQNPVHQLLHRWHETVGVKGIFAKQIGAMPCKHQIFVYRCTMGNILQRLLNAEAAWVSETTR